MLWFTYFETGYGKTGYIKIFIYLLGFGSAFSDTSLIWTFIAAAIYGVFCQVFGWVWFDKELFAYQAEVGNQHNPLAKELRNSMKKGKV